MPNNDGGLLANALSLVKHAGVGLVSPFMDGGPSPAELRMIQAAKAKAAQPGANILDRAGGYLADHRISSPVLAEQAPAALTSIYNFVANKLHGPELHTGYTDDMIHRVGTADQGARELMQTGAPQNGLETAAEIAGSMVLPGPKIGKVAKPATDLAGHVANAGRVAAKVGAEMLVPGRQGGAGTAAAATAIGTGANEVLDAVHNDPDYASIADATKQVLQPEKRKPWTEYMSPEVANDWHTAVQTGDEATQQAILGAIKPLQDHDIAESYLPSRPAWENYGVEAAAAGALALGAWATHHALQGTQARIKFGSELAGKDFPQSYTPGPTKAVQGVVQSDQSIREASKELTGDKNRIVGSSPELDQIKAKLDGVTVSSLQSKIKHFMVTGQIHNSTVNTTPLSPLLEAIATDLQPPERSLLTDGLLAKSALDDWKRTGEKVQFMNKPDGSGTYSMADLQHMTNLVDTNPKLAKYATAVRDQYVKQLDYMLEKGRITQDMYNDFRLQRPNFVHMSRNVGDDKVATLWGRGDTGTAAYNLRDTLIRGRATEAGAGVRAGATADPVVDLPNQWAELIHNLEINDVKKDWLQAASDNSELGKIVRPIALGERPKNLEQVHAVWQDGQELHYKVKDASLSDALDFTPFTNRSTLAAFMDTPRKLFQQGTTGIGNPLFAGTAAVYDTITGIMLRPKSYDLGVVNEFMNKATKGKYNLGAFDPTMWVTAPIGAVRHAADSLTGAVANELATQLTRGSGIALDTLGEDATQQLQQILARRYQGSIKSIMEEHGAAGSSPFLATLPDQVAPGMKDIAPKFASRATMQAFDDAVRGNADTSEKVIQGSRSLWEQARANNLARLYTGVMKSIHEGFRYQAFATNLPKVDLFSPEDMTLLASQTRRLAADIGQQGTSKLVQDITHSAAYSNIAVQTLAEIARKMKDQPVTTMFNMMSALTGLAMLRYGAMATDPTRRDEIRNGSDSQNSAHFKTFGGLTVNVPPELRVISAPLFAALDYMSGVHDVGPEGKDNFNPNLAQAMMQWLDGGMQSPEEMHQSVMDSFTAAAESASPVTPGSFPLINAAMATQGIDVPFSRFTGKGEPIKTQPVSPLYGEGTLTNDAMNASWQHAIADVIGSGSWGYVRSAMDFDRARHAGGDLEDSVRVALSRIVDQQAATQGPLQGMVFRNHEKAQTANTTEARLWYNKRDGIDKVTQIMNKDILSIYTDSLDPRSALLSNLSPMELEKKPELLHTPLPIIGGTTAQLLKALKPIQAHLGQLQQQVNDVQNQSVDTPVLYQENGGKRLSTIEERNRQINSINQERKMYMGMMLRYTQMAEDQIRQSIGDPSFTFQNFDPKKYSQMQMPTAP